MTARLAVVSVVRWIPALAWMSWIFWLSSQQTLPPTPGISVAIAAIAGHFLLYAMLAALMLIALGAPRRLSSRSVAVAGFAALAYALSDEYHQSFVPGRSASLFDLIVDAAGIASMLTVWVLRWRHAATY